MFKLAQWGPSILNGMYHVLIYLITQDSLVGEWIYNESFRTQGHYLVTISRLLFLCRLLLILFNVMPVGDCLGNTFGPILCVLADSYRLRLMLLLLLRFFFEVTGTTGTHVANKDARTYQRTVPMQQETYGTRRRSSEPHQYFRWCGQMMLTMMNMPTGTDKNHDDRTDVQYVHNTALVQYYVS